MTLTTDQIRHLATWVCSFRDWQHNAVCRALWTLRDNPPAILASAATRAALDADIRTPDGITWLDRAHWQPDPQHNHIAADQGLDRRHQERLREEHEWAKAAKPTPQRIKDLRHLARHGITPTSSEAHNWLRNNPTPTQPHNTRRPSVLSLRHNNHDNTVTITLTVPEADAATYQQLIRETTQAFTNHESPEA